MPRTARVRKSQRTLTDQDPQTAIADELATNKGGSPGRKSNGQFARGNPGGPGNPHARFSAAMLTIARQTMTPEKIAAVFESIYVKALSGDMTAAKLLLHYTIGKPGDAPHPDHLERDEWDLYQKNAMTLDEMKQALSLPCSLGNEIVSTALPAMTAARANELAAQLKGQEGRTKNQPKGRSGVPAPKNTQDQAATAVDPWDIDVAPPLTNGKSADKSSSADSHRRSAKNQFPATRNQPPSTSSAPLTNGVSGCSAKAKNQRKLVAKQWLQPLTKKLTGPTQKTKNRQRARA